MRKTKVRREMSGFGAQVARMVAAMVAAMVSVTGTCREQGRDGEIFLRQSP
jgi:hypothetical protein